MSLMYHRTKWISCSLTQSCGPVDVNNFIHSSINIFWFVRTKVFMMNTKWMKQYGAGKRSLILD